jgi:hydrogenase maturation protease
VAQPSLLVGIGSPHGDDAVGWLVARQVAARLGKDVVARCARSPSELLDWLDGIEVLDVCDAIVGTSRQQPIYCWQWPAAEITTSAFCGSHDFSLPAVLLLAERLGRLPTCVRIWGVPIEPGESFALISPAATASVEHAVDRICGELAHA